MKFELGLFDDPYKYLDADREKEVIYHPDNHKGVLEMAKKSIVLLKNENQLLPLKKENQTIASVTYQNFFRTYKKLSGMTGTAVTEAPEFEGIYNLQVLAIPPNIKVNRKDHEDQIFMTKKEKYNYEVIFKFLSGFNKNKKKYSINSKKLFNDYFSLDKVVKNLINKNKYN